MPKVNGSEKPQVLPARTSPDRFLKFYHAIGRLRPGITFERGQAQLDAVAQQLEQEYPDSNQGRHFNQVAITKELLGTLDSGLLLLLLGAVGLVVLIVSTNVANLLLTLGIGRRQEQATRQGTLFIPRRPSDPAGNPESPREASVDEGGSAGTGRLPRWRKNRQSQKRHRRSRARHRTSRWGRGASCPLSGST